MDNVNDSELFDGVENGDEGSGQVGEDSGSQKTSQANKVEQKLSLEEKLQKKAEQIADDSEPENRWNKKSTDNKPAKKIDPKSTITKDNLTKKLPERKSDDLMDDDGNIIAKAGAERRIYEESQKIKKDWNTFQTTVLPKIKEEYDAAMSRAQKLEQLDGLVKANGLTHDEMNTIAQVAVTFKKNPVEALKMMLTNAVNQGYDVSEILNAGQTHSIESILNKKLEPLQRMFEERKNQSEEEQRNEAIRNEIKEFQETFPHSQTHSKEIVEVTKKMGLEPSIQNYTKAYWKLRSFYEQKGYDFSKVWSQSANNQNLNQKTQIVENVDEDNDIGGVPLMTRNTTGNNGNLNGDIGVNASYRDIIGKVFEEFNRKG